MDTVEHTVSQPHLAELNAAQRIAAIYGITEGQRVNTSPPLLIIAGAGSGKTKTLTHRVAHLILNGADPRRILLMTFARRMAAEMTKRVESICARAFKGRSAIAADAVEWSGTFHAIGAKLLRLHAETIGLYSRIFPMWYAPIVVLESDEYVIKPMRYHCRPNGKPEAYDKKYDVNRGEAFAVSG